jgi:hypothetical protein
MPRPANGLSVSSRPALADAASQPNRLGLFLGGHNLGAGKSAAAVLVAKDLVQSGIESHYITFDCLLGRTARRTRLETSSRASKGLRASNGSTAITRRDCESTYSTRAR